MVTDFLMNLADFALEKNIFRKVTIRLATFQLLLNTFAALFCMLKYQ